MNARLFSIHQLMEQERSALVRQLAHLSGEAFNRHPAGKWSINEIMAHIVAAERLSLQYMQKKILGAETAGDTGWWEEVKMLFLKLSQRIPGLKYRAPRVVVESTRPYRDFRHLDEDWQQLRLELGRFLEGLPDDYLKRKIYKHVFAGRLNVQHALLFFREHITHHRPQIEKLLKSK